MVPRVDREAIHARLAHGFFLSRFCDPAASAKTLSLALGTDSARFGSVGHIRSNLQYIREFCPREGAVVAWALADPDRAVYGLILNLGEMLGDDDPQFIGPNVEGREPRQCFKVVGLKLRERFLGRFALITHYAEPC